MEQKPICYKLGCKGKQKYTCAVCGTLLCLACWWLNNKRDNLCVACVRFIDGVLRAEVADILRYGLNDKKVADLKRAIPEYNKPEYNE